MIWKKNILAWSSGSGSDKKVAGSEAKAYNWACNRFIMTGYWSPSLTNRASASRSSSVNIWVAYPWKKIVKIQRFKIVKIQNPENFVKMQRLCAAWLLSTVIWREKFRKLKTQKNSWKCWSSALLDCYPLRFDEKNYNNSKDIKISLKYNFIYLQAKSKNLWMK